MNKNKILNIIIYSLIVAIIIISIFLTINLFSNDNNELPQSKGEVISYSVTFSLNGASKIDYKNASCILNQNGCWITLPNASREDGEILGYSINKDDTTAKYKIGDRLSLSGNMILYVISKKENRVAIHKRDVNYIEKEELKCEVFNEEKDCTVTLPIFNKTGYENRGYSTSLASLTGFIFPNEEYRISKNVELYPIYGLSNHLETINVEQTYKFRDSFIEIENACPESVTDTYISYIKEINQNLPFLLNGNKITFLNDDTFSRIWGNNYVGMNYGPKNLRSVDIRCSTAVINDYYGTMVHEMSHSWDFYYGVKMGANMSSQSDIINLFNKYSNLSFRPFRDYSYSSIYEFQADMVKYYYFKYIVPRSGYKDLDFPQDIKETMEKYLCIAHNSYDDKECVR